MKPALILPFILFALLGSAQNWGPSAVEKESNLYFVITGGGLYSSVIYSRNELEDISIEAFLSHTEGLGLRYSFGNKISVGADFSYRPLGFTANENNLSVRSNYMNVFIPVEFDCCALNKRSKTKPSILFFAGPYLASHLNGTIENEFSEIVVTQNECEKLDFGTEAGIGVRIPIFSTGGKSNLNFRLSYFRGFKNTLPANFRNYESEELSQLGLATTGTRMNHGVRATISYDLSLKKGRVTTFTAGGDGKRTYKKFVNIK